MTRSNSSSASARLLGRRQREPAAADHLLAGPAEDPLGGPVPEPDARVEAELHERERRRLDQRLQLLARSALAHVQRLDDRDVLRRPVPPNAIWRASGDHVAGTPLTALGRALSSRLLRPSASITYSAAPSLRGRR